MFRAIGIVAIAAVSQPAWCAVKYLSFASASMSPVAGLVPSAARSILQPLAAPVAWLLCIRALVSKAAPDKWRTLCVWRRLLPIFLAYVWFQKRVDSQQGLSDEEKQKRWDHQHEWGGKKVHSMISYLGGFYVKSAQVMASKGEFMPPQWCSRLAQLWDSVPARPWRHVKRSVQGDLRESPLARSGFLQHRQLHVQDCFVHVEEQALAAASIAQVHGARLSDALLQQLQQQPGGWAHGPEVVLKVQHADVQRLMGSDLRNMGRVARFLRGILPFDVLPIVTEMQKVIPREFDFRREAKLMAAIRRNLAAAGLDGKVLVPEPVACLSAQGLIVQQRVSGTPFTEVLRACAAGDVQLQERAQAAVMELLKVYGHMMLRDGLFHADPHPGNFFMRDDGSIALLDFGQCKALSASQQACLCRLYQGLARGRALQVAQCAASFGLHLGLVGDAAKWDLQAVVKMVTVMFDTRYIPEAVASPFGGGAIVEGAPVAEFPGELYLICRAVLILRGVCYALGMDVVLAELWLPLAEASLGDLAGVQARAAENCALVGEEGGGEGGQVAGVVLWLCGVADVQICGC